MAVPNGCYYDGKKIWSNAGSGEYKCQSITCPVTDSNPVGCIKPAELAADPNAQQGILLPICRKLGAALLGPQTTAQGLPEMA